MNSKPAKESKAIRNLRQKVKEKLKLEAKAMSKRTLKNVQKIIHLQLAEQARGAQVAPVRKQGRPRKHTNEQILHTLREKVLTKVHKVSDEVQKIRAISRRISSHIPKTDLTPK